MRLQSVTKAKYVEVPFLRTLNYQYLYLLNFLMRKIILSS